MSSLLLLKNIHKTFYLNHQPLTVLKDVNFVLHSGDMVALTGVSGTGKTTLLQIMGLLDWPTEGTVTIKQTTFSSKKSFQCDLVRRNCIGFVYQYHYLLPELTALENVMLPQRIAGISYNQAKEHAMELLKELKIDDRSEHTSNQLSGGQQQRVAIARALANQPDIILADEPTGNLDGETAEQVFDMLLDLTEQHKAAVVVATHDLKLAHRMTRHIHLHNGTLIETE